MLFVDALDHTDHAIDEAGPAMTLPTRFLILGLICPLAGCLVQQGEDVSSRENLQHFQGAVIKLHEDMEAIGITLDQNYRTGVDEIHLVPRPGFAGPGVKGREEVPAGTEVTVVGAVAVPGLIPREKIYFVVTGPKCSFCQRAKILVEAGMIDGNPQLPDL